MRRFVLLLLLLTSACWALPPVPPAPPAPTPIPVPPQPPPADAIPHALVEQVADEMSVDALHALLGAPDRIFQVEEGVEDHTWEPALDQHGIVRRLEVRVRNGVVVSRVLW